MENLPKTDTTCDSLRVRYLGAPIIPTTKSDLQSEMKFLLYMDKVSGKNDEREEAKIMIRNMLKQFRGRGDHIEEPK